LIVEGIAFGVAASSVRLGFPHAPDFLGSVVTFETTSVALIVPLSLNWAFTVYSTYQSRAVREQLFRDPVLSRLVVVTILNVLVVILAHAVFSATPEAAALWKSLSVFGFINCFIVAWLLLAYLRQLREQIITEPDWILDRMTTDALTELEDIE
jgi:hypothetical protein